MRIFNISLLFLSLFLLPVLRTLGQSKGTILVIANRESKVLVDGEELDGLEANKPKKFELITGEHYLQVISIIDNNEKNEILTIVADKQIVLKYKFDEPDGDKLLENRILIADIDINIPGIVTAAADENFEYPKYYYAFEKGDDIVFHLDMSNAKGTNVINIFSFPDGNIIYSNDKFTDLKDLRVKAKERSIYGISLGSNHVFDRDARLTIERVPESKDSEDFNTKVSWQETYRVEIIQKPQKFYVNSGSHSTFQGGKSRIVIPLSFPSNTVKWYFEFSATRDKDQIESISGALSLASELSTLIDQSGILGFGIDQLTQPPGSDYCDIYLLDHQNSGLFTRKEDFTYLTQGTRENIKSGVVEMQCCTNINPYLGIRNPDNFHGIHVAIEVAAIVKEEGWVMHHEE